MALEDDDLRHLMAAEGYLLLGMPTEAKEELENIDPDMRHVPEVLRVRLEIYRNMEKWEPMHVVAVRLAEIEPSEPRWPLAAAYAMSRGGAMEVAKAILGEAVTTRPDVAMYHFALACYTCQLGDIEGAKAWLKIAITISPKLRVAALEDPDLEPLWDWL